MDFEIMTAYTRALSENNNRTWFHDNHREYEKAQDEFLALLDVLKFVIVKEAPKLGDSIMFTSPKAFMYRIPRDMRYSTGKEPYNPSFRAYFSPMKKEFLPFGYFFFLSHERCSIGTGAYPWTTAQLNTLREYVARNYEELDDIVITNGIRVNGREMKRVPRGYESDHPAVEWLKHKYFTCSYFFIKEDMADIDTFADAAAEAVRRFEPLRQYFMGAFEGSYEEPDYEFDM